MAARHLLVQGTSPGEPRGRPCGEPSGRRNARQAVGDLDDGIVEVRANPAE